MPKKKRAADKNAPVNQRDFAKLKKVEPRNKHQGEYFEAIESNSVVIAAGPAGSGKTFVAVYTALAHLFSKKFKRIIITRPAIEAGEKLGFLPGDLEDKLDPYLRPIFDALYDIAGVEIIRDKIERGYIEIAPLAYMRGRNFTNCFVIVDEAQNATLEQLKMVVTRVGDNCKMIVNGDPGQSDLPFRRDKRPGLSALQEIVEGIDNVATIKFDKADIVRSKVVTDIVAAFEKYEESNESKN